MENKKQINTTDWINDRMAELEPAGDWQPNGERALAHLRECERRTTARRRAWGWGTAFASMACVVVLAVPATRAAIYRVCTAACAVVWPSVLAEDPEDSAVSTGRVSDSTPATPVFPSGKLPQENALHDSRPAPDFALGDSYGRVTRLSDFRGKVVLLNFWATWCHPCKIEMSWFVDFQRRYRDRGFTVVAVSLDEEGWAAVRPFLEELNPNFPVVVGDDELAEGFGGVAALPTTFLIDRDGKIRDRYMGLVSASEYESGIERLLAGC